MSLLLDPSRSYYRTGFCSGRVELPTHWYQCRKPATGTTKISGWEFELCEEHNEADCAMLPEEFLAPYVNLDHVDTLQPGSKTDVVIAFHWLRILGAFASAVQELDFSEFGKQPDDVLSRVNTIRELIGRGDASEGQDTEDSGEAQGSVADEPGSPSVPVD